MLRRFAGEESGSIGALLTFGSLALLGAVSVSLDYTRMTNARAALSAAVDAAALAAAQAPTSQAAARARQVFDANFRDIGEVTSFDATPFSQDTNNTFRVEATANVQMTLTKMAGWDTRAVRARSEVTIGSDHDIQAALVLDVTGSMTATKLEDMKTSATSMINVLFDNLTRAGQVKMSIVPFSDYVKLNKNTRDKPWISVPPDTSSTEQVCSQKRDLIGQINCRQELVKKTNCNDGVCTTTETWMEKCTNQWGPWYEVCADKTTKVTWNGCVGSRDYPLNVRDSDYATHPVPGLMNTSCAVVMSPLTPNRGNLLKTITGLKAGGETYIPSGLMWGWATLSPGEPFNEPTNAQNTTKRYLVLMTDGANTKSPNYPDHKGSDPVLADTLTAELCTNIKAAAIEIFTIAFDVDTDTIRDLLRNCASTTDKYYDAANATQLSDAFENIAKQMANLRIVK